MFQIRSYRTTLCLQYSASHIALGAIFLAAVHLDIKPLNSNKSRNAVELSWFKLLESDIDEDSLKSELLM